MLRAERRGNSSRPRSSVNQVTIEIVVLTPLAPTSPTLRRIRRAAGGSFVHDGSGGLALAICG
jgi:hypothetical protein